MKAYDSILETETFEKFDTNRIKGIGRLEKEAFVRNRKMSFKDMLRCILCQKGKTITMEINYYFKETDKKEDRVTKQAFSKQRCLLNPEIFIQLSHEYVESLYKTGEYKTYKEYILTAIDGTILEIPNTEELLKEYECQQMNSQNVRKSARAKVSGIYNVQNNIMIDAIIDKYTANEREQAKNNIESMLKLIGNERKIITIFDRRYISVEMLIFLMNLPIFYLFRVPGDKYIDEKNSMKTNDEFVDIKITKGRLENIIDKQMRLFAKQSEKIKVRMIRINTINW